MMKKIFIVLSALLWASGSQAALRGTAVQANTSTSTTITVSLSGISGLADGDVLLCAIDGGGGGTNTYTFPAGFSTISGLTEQGLNSSTTFAVESEVVSGTPPTSVTITSSASDFQTAECRAYSGRSGTVTATALTAATSFSGSTSPQSLSLTGLTAATGDDIVLFEGVDNNNNAGTDTYTLTAPTSFANSLTTYAAATSYSPIMGSSDEVNAPSGSTGTLASSLTFTNGHQATQYAGFLISLAASGGATCTHPGWNLATGTFTVPTAGSGSFYHACGTGAGGTVDCSTQKYWSSAGGGTCPVN